MEFQLCTFGVDRLDKVNVELPLLLHGVVGDGSPAVGARDLPDQAGAHVVPVVDDNVLNNKKKLLLLLFKDLLRLD